MAVRPNPPPPSPPPFTASDAPHPSLGSSPATTPSIPTSTAPAPSAPHSTASSASTAPTADASSPATAGCYTSISADCATLFPSSTLSPPSPSSCTILFIDDDDVFLYRVNGDLYGGWTRLRLPLPEVLPSSEVVGPTTVFSGGKFYCISNLHCFYVVDPALPRPLVRVVDMDTVQIPREQWSNFLVEFDGEVLMAVTLREGNVFLGFQVFRPGYYEKMWVRVDSVGDRALFIHNRCGFSLSAADVGCKKNCIYLPQAFQRTKISLGFLVQGDFFDVFDLETGRWNGEQPPQDAGVKVDFAKLASYDGIWLLPRLDSISREH